MAAEYFLYTTLYNNILVNRSNSSFAPLPPNTGEIYIDYFIPQTQPLFYYRESSSSIVFSTQDEIDEYLNASAPPPQPDDYVTVGMLTGYTASTSGGTGSVPWGNITGTLSTQIDLWNQLTGKTSLTVFQTYTGTTAPATYVGKIAFNAYSGTTIPNTYYNKAQTASLFVNTSGDTMTGSLSTSGNFTAVGLVSGSSVCGGTWIHTPIICADTCIRTGMVCSLGAISAVNRVSGSTVYGSTCVYSPIVLASTCSCSPVHCGACGAFTTCSIAPITCGSTCLVGGAVKGTILSGSTCVYSPITCGTTRVQSPIVCGSTCVTSPITCGTTCSISPIVLGSTCVCSPTVCSSTCLCSTGTARFTGNVTAASCVNISGATKIVGVDANEVIFGNRTTCALTGSSQFIYNSTGCTLCVPYIRITGAGSYFYSECTTNASTTTTTCQLYLGYCPTTFVAGRYQVDFSAQYGNSKSNGCSHAAFKIDNTIQGTVYLSRQQVNGWNSAISLSRDITLTAGTHCFDVYYWAGTNTACMAFASVRIKRIC